MYKRLGVATQTDKKRKEEEETEEDEIDIPQYEIIR